ncbi:MAG: hypothetical protein N7Q72_03220, partial [Spiroplasma sp. Tabriz.8]|nr:hypothetical protein [Spiroplasma sp. Tabriz.8]
EKFIFDPVNFIATPYCYVNLYTLLGFLHDSQILTSHTNILLLLLLLYIQFVFFFLLHCYYILVLIISN